MRDQIDKGRLEGAETLEATATVRVDGLEQDILVSGRIALAERDER